jgi:L-threonylcarbamoyladenylate synthase
MTPVRWLTVDAAGWAPRDLEPAVRWLAGGGIVAFPTDTLYGLAVDPFSETSVAALFDLKGREANVAVPIIAASSEHVESAIGPLAGATRRLATRFWPGPLSLILDAPDGMAAQVHGGTGTIAVRVPAHVVARALTSLCGGLLTATSANRSGFPPADRAETLADLAADPRVFVLDGGPSPGGPPSTIVDARVEPIRVLRAGAIAATRVLESLHG